MRRHARTPKSSLVKRKGAHLAVRWFAIGLAGLLGCGQKPEAPVDVAVAAVTPQAAPSGTDIVGFESTAGWKVSSGTVALSTTALTQGSAALAVTAPQNYTTLVSGSLSSNLAPLAGLTNVGATVEVDMELPTSQPNQFYDGALQLYVSVPSHGVFNQYLGQSELTGQQLGTFQTYQFAVTSFVRNQLAGSTFSDLTFTLALNAPAGAKGTYIFDNLRTTSPATAQVGSGPSVDLIAQLGTSPTSNTPGFATFTTGTIQIPASFHVKIGDAGTGTALFELGFGSTTTVSCKYVASSDTTSYVFSSCSTGNVAGDIVSANFARLTLQSADPAQPLTKVRAQLAYNALGDQVGTKLVPPIPTFWGTTLAEINTISQAFTQLQINNPPPAERFVALPIPDFAKRQGDGSPVNALNGATPRAPSDPPFDFKGDLNNSSDGSPSGQFDAYYEIAGSISAADNNQDFTSHFDATGTVGVVVLGNNVQVLRVATTVDTDNGGTSSGGSNQPTGKATFQAFVFGDQIENDSTTQQTGFSFNPTISQSFETPPIPIWIFSIQGGVTASAGVQFTGALAINGFQLTATPQASVSANIEGGVNIGVASGGVNVTVQLIDVQMPTTATLAFDISTDPSVCAATLNANVNGSVKLSSGGGSVALQASIGPCPFCYSDSWNIFSWSGLNLGTIAFPAPFPIQIGGQVFTLPTSLCREPLNVTISQPTNNASEFATIAFPTLVSASRPPANGQLVGDSVDCNFITWTSSDPGATFSPSAVGCSPLVTFSPAVAGTTQTITATAVDQFGETGSATVNLTVATAPNGPVPQIIAPLPGSRNGSGVVTLEGTFSGGTGTVTATWTVDGSATPVDTQTFLAGSGVQLAPFTLEEGNGGHTFTLNVTDSTAASNSASVSIQIEIPQ
jgi:hypothetical protein